ncbi:EamA family transporter [Patescibacteria group bacterium]|nr:EamA family transporter [Patescibacteria group bacterium]
MPWYFFAIMAALLGGLATITQKNVLRKEHAMSYAATLGLANLLLCLPLIFFVDWRGIDLKVFIYLLLISFVAAAAFLLVAKGVRHMEISASSPLFIIGPAITALLAYLILGESFSRWQTLGLGFLILGLYILESHKSAGWLEPFKIIRGNKYIHYIFLALVLYGITGIVDRVVLGYYQLDTLTYIFLIHLFLGINLLAMIFIWHDGFNDLKIGFKQAGWWIVLVSFLTISYRWFQAEAISMAYVGLVIAIKRTESLFSTLVGGEIWQEKNLFHKLMAAGVMILGTVLIVLG